MCVAKLLDERPIAGIVGAAAGRRRDNGCRYGRLHLCR